jgi:threonine/homoserine/homoserine lactone efflux protein
VTLTLSSLLLYIGALGILFITPGPVWMALTARALAGGFASAWPLAVGVTVGDFLWPLAAIFGLSWIVDQFDLLMAVMRFVAAVFFAVMGWLLIRHASQPISTDSRLTRPGRWAGFMAGAAVIMGNPKAILFYMGVLPGFFDLRHITGPDIAVIALVSMTVPLIGNLMLAALVARARARLTNARTMVRINQVAGVLLILVGALIGLVRM